MLQEARGKAKGLGWEEGREVRFQEMDVEALGFEEDTFDYVVDSFSLW
jgi:ubiquinone/menaquinone biosynthesis C-methylase UbiE